MRKRFARLIVVRADQAPTSSLEQENARGSKFSSTTAFFDSIGQTQTSMHTSARSALPLSTDIISLPRHVREVPILLQKSKSNDPKNLAKVDF